jgi:hypothetical protein
MLVAIVTICISQTRQKLRPSILLSQVFEGASFNATKKLQWRLAVTEARLIKPVTPRDPELTIVHPFKFLFTHRPALIALFVAGRDAHHPPSGGCQ